MSKARTITVYENEREPPTVAGRVPPNDLDAEAVVLSAVMLGGVKTFGRVSDVLSEDSFFSDPNKAIWRAIAAVAADGTPIDTLTVAHWLRNREQIQRIGGATYLGQIVDATPAVANVVAHAHAVQRLCLRRRVIATCQRYAAEGYGDIGNDQSWVDSAARDLRHLAERSANLAASAISVGRSANQAAAEVHDRIERGQLMGTSTGIEPLDDETAGVHGGDFTVLSAKTGGGKTALACALSVNIADAWHQSEGKRGGGVGFVSLEMPHKQLSTRMACSLGRVNWHAVRLGHATNDDYGKIVAGAELLRDLPITIDDRKPATIADVCARARRMRDDFAKRGIPMRLFVIDYVQKIIGKDEVDRNATRERELARVAEMLVALAEELDTCVMGLAQLTDDGLVRDCRAIVHEACGWWDLSIEAQKRKGPRVATVRIKKQRHAPHPVEASLWFHPAIVWFSDMEVLPCP